MLLVLEVAETFDRVASGQVPGWVGKIVNFGDPHVGVTGRGPSSTGWEGVC